MEELIEIEECLIKSPDGSTMRVINVSDFKFLFVTKDKEGKEKTINLTPNQARQLGEWLIKNSEEQ